MPRSPTEWIVAAVALALVAPALISLAPWVLACVVVAVCARVLWFYTRH